MFEHVHVTELDLGVTRILRIQVPAREEYLTPPETEDLLSIRLPRGRNRSTGEG